MPEELPEELQHVVAFIALKPSPTGLIGLDIRVNALFTMANKDVQAAWDKGVAAFTKVFSEAIGNPGLTEHHRRRRSDVNVPESDKVFEGLIDDNTFVTEEKVDC